VRIFSGTEKILANTRFAGTVLAVTEWTNNIFSSRIIEIVATDIAGHLITIINNKKEIKSIF